ncbi:cytochrome P450 [Streptomyces sp. HB132]|uniref:cytochrome P450 n=1 Tax=Streptomyces sp. HB132 TaxID=767388 RepID=UPI001961BCE9|nr:cytochrome P450 [Streptomyces sp. HB132]
MTAQPQLPPVAPGGLPFLGHALSLAGGSSRLHFLQGLRHIGPMVRISVGPRPLMVINDPDLIHELLTGHLPKHLDKGILFAKLKLFGKDALPVAEGARHLQRRRLVQPSLHHKQVSGYVDSMVKTIEQTIAPWRDGATLDLKTEMQLITQSVITETLFSSHPPRDAAGKILRSVDTVFMAALQRAFLPLRLLERLPTPGNRRLKEAGDILRRTVEDIISAHRSRPDAFDDVVSLLLNLTDENGAPLEEDDVLSEITGLLAAGSETTAVVMAWLFYELARNPDLEKRMHSEIDSVLNGAPLTAEHIPRLAFTGRLVTETLRLYSPAWLVTRRTTSDVELGGFDLPAGTDLIFSPYTLHRDPSLYPDPQLFDPDRWLPERVQPPPNAFIPFGAGKRMCMGDRFAVTEAISIAAIVGSRWRLRLAQGPVVRPVGAITTHPSWLRMVAETRRPDASGL